MDQEVLDLHDPEDVVDAPVADREARVRALADLPLHLLGGVVQVEPDDLLHRRHQLAGPMAAEPEHARDDLVLRRAEDPRLDPLPEQDVDLLLGGGAEAHPPEHHRRRALRSLARNDDERDSPLASEGSRCMSPAPSPRLDQGIPRPDVPRRVGGADHQDVGARLEVGEGIVIVSAGVSKRPSSGKTGTQSPPSRAYAALTSRVRSSLSVTDAPRGPGGRSSRSGASWSTMNGSLARSRVRASSGLFDGRSLAVTRTPVEAGGDGGRVPGVARLGQRARRRRRTQSGQPSLRMCSV